MVFRSREIIGLVDFGVGLLSSLPNENLHCEIAANRYGHFTPTTQHELRRWGKLELPIDATVVIVGNGAMTSLTL